MLHCNIFASASQHFCLCIAGAVDYRCALSWPCLKAGRAISRLSNMGECEVVWRLLRDPAIAWSEQQDDFEAQPARKYAQTPAATSNQNAPDIRIARRNVRGHGHFRSRLRPVLTGLSTPCTRASAGCSLGVAAGSDQRGRWVIIV